MSRCAIVTAVNLLLISALTSGTHLEPSAFKNPHFVDGREAIVKLLEWKWNDIADECERFLGPKGYAGVQTSPVTENLIAPTRNWLERYQPISYRWITRSGNEREFKDMVKRCNNVGVRIYVDLVLNHMTKDDSKALGTGGSIADTKSRYYPAVPYSTEHFNPHCEIENWSEVAQIRNCFHGAHDLDQSNDHVREKIVNLMNDLVAAGVAGFVIDLASAMWPDDLEEIYSRVNYLNTEHGFSNNSRPYICQSVWNMEGDPISKYEYNSFTAVTEFLYPVKIAEALNGLLFLQWVKELINPQHFLPSNDAIIFIDNQLLQRMSFSPSLSFKSSKLHKIATAFMLAHPYGNPIIMSSYDFDDGEQGPPTDENENVTSPIIRDDDSCDGGWICEHRWPQISNMIGFRRTVSGTTIEHSLLNDNFTMLAFSRGDQGFIAINAGEANLDGSIQTNLPAGLYCDVISGNFANGRCSGDMVVVNVDGMARIFIPSNSENGVIAIHRNARVPNAVRLASNLQLTNGAA